MAERYVGLDIGTSAVRAVEVAAGDGARPVLENYGQVGLPPGTVVDGEIRDRTQVVQAIERLWHEGGFTGRKVVLGVAGLRAITREIDMPPVPLEELDVAVQYQADEVIPFPMERTAISTKVIAQYTDADGNPQIRVLVAAAHRDLIDALVQTVQQAGLEPVGIDLNTAALARALYDPSFTGGPEAIVSVGAGLTMVVVHQAGQLQFVRTIDLGGNNVTQAVASALDLPLTDAEDVKRKLGEPGLHDSRAESAAAATVDELVGEIHNSIRFYSSLPGRGNPSRLLVTGAGARTAGFLPKLQQGLEVPVVPASPLSMVDSRLPISPEQAAAINPTLAVPVGLSLPDPSGRPFNLLPAEVTAKYAERKITRSLLVAGLVVLLLLIGGTVWRILSVNHAQNQVSSLKAQLNTINQVTIPRYSQTVRLASEISQLQSQMKPLVATEINWLVVLNQFGQYMTPTSVFTQMQLGTGGATSTSSSSSSSSSGKALGKGSASVDVPGLLQFTQFGNAIDQAPGLTVGQPSQTIQVGSQISFNIQFTINANTRGSRQRLFTQKVP